MISPMCCVNRQQVRYLMLAEDGVKSAVKRKHSSTER